MKKERDPAASNIEKNSYADGHVLRFLREEPQHPDDSKEGSKAGEAENPQNSHRVATLGRRIAAAIEKHEVAECPNTSGAGLDEREADIAWLIVDAEEVFRKAAVGRGDHDYAGVRELRHLAVRTGNANIMEAGGLGKIGDGILRASQEMYGLRGARGLDHGEEELLLGSGGGRSIGRIDAGDNNVVVMAGVEAALMQRRCHPVEHLRAKHLAVVVHERDHDWAIVIEKVAERDVAAGFIFEGIAQGERAVEVLINPGVLLPCGALLRGGANGTVGRILGTSGQRDEQEAQCEKKAYEGTETVHISEYAAPPLFHGSGCRTTVFPVRAD